MLTTQDRMNCRRPVRKLETGAKRASQLILPKQYSHDLGVIVSRLLEENVSGYLHHLSVDPNTTNTSDRSYSNRHTFALSLAKNVLILLIMNAFPPSPMSSLHASIDSIASVWIIPPTVMQSGAKGTLRRGPYSFFFSIARLVRIDRVESTARSEVGRRRSWEVTAVRACFDAVRAFWTAMEMIETSCSVTPSPEMNRKSVRRSSRRSGEITKLKKEKHNVITINITLL
jgi:hypothetical protein